MALPYLFAAATTATGAQLDADFAALGAFVTVPCAVTGTNALALTPAAAAPNIGVYANYMLFSGVASATNSSAVTAQVSGLASLNVYKDTIAGPAPLVGNEIVQKNAILLAYDSALNSGAGGFHLLVEAFPLTPPVGNPAVFVTSTTGVTLSASNLTGIGTGLAVITRSGAVAGGFNDTTDTATNIIGAITRPAVGMYLSFRIINLTGQTQTLVGGTGVTLVGPVTTAASDSHTYQAVITNIGSPAVVVYG